jgi:hypothetical protein
MAKIRIGGVGFNGENYTVNVVVTETQFVEDKDIDVPLGEAAVSFPKDTEAADIKDKIEDAAKGIMDANTKAKDKRKDIEEIEFAELE